MKRNLTLFRGARLGLLALALPLLSACYSTVGYDGRTMLRPLSSPGPYYSTATLSAPIYGPAHPGLIPIGGYRAVQGFTYYTHPHGHVALHHPGDAGLYQLPPGFPAAGQHRRRVHRRA